MYVQGKVIIQKGASKAQGTFEELKAYVETELADDVKYTLPSGQKPVSFLEVCVHAFVNQICICVYAYAFMHSSDVHVRVCVRMHSSFRCACVCML